MKRTGTAGPRLSLGEKLLRDATPGALPIGLQILKVAYDERGGGFVVQNRQDPRLFKFFKEGVSWSEEQWRAQFSKGPHWCAAFVSYCYRKAYEQAGLPLPRGFKGAASVDGMRRIFEPDLLSRERAFDGNCIRDDARGLLGPGDIVVTKGHVALLTGFTEDKGETVINTIEGNTCIWVNGTPESAAWGIHPREHRASKLAGGLVGFLRATAAGSGQKT